MLATVCSHTFLPIPPISARASLGGRTSCRGGARVNRPLMSGPRRGHRQLKQECRRPAESVQGGVAPLRALFGRDDATATKVAPRPCMGAGPKPLWKRPALLAAFGGSLRAGRPHSGFGPAPVHGRGATLIAVASSRPNSARRVELLRRLGLIRTVSDTPALIVGVHDVAWARHQGTVYLRLTSTRRAPAEAYTSGYGLPRQKAMASNRRPRHAHRELPFVSVSSPPYSLAPLVP